MLQPENTINIDLRSDVVTRAPTEMLKLMSEYQFVHESRDYDDLITVKLEGIMANMFGKESGIFFPTTTMANVASVIGWAKPGSEVIIASNSHSVERESSSFALLAGVQTRQIGGESGLFTVEQASSRIRKAKDLVTFPDTQLIFIQNGTFNGRVWPLQTLKQMKKMAEGKSVSVHIDGARIFNALAHYNCKPIDLTNVFDSMSICLTKGLCCPIGSIVIGPTEFISRLKSVRKGLGGGIWHNGLLSIGGLYSLQHILPEINKDNEIAVYLAKQLSQFSVFEIDLSHVQINMVPVHVRDDKFDHTEFEKHLRANGIIVKPYNHDSKFYRLVTHRGIRQEQCDKAVTVIREFLAAKSNLEKVV